MKKHLYATEKEYVSILKKADLSFHNADPNLEVDEIMSDDTYDLIKDELMTRFPENAYLKTIGATIGKSSRKIIKHEIPMGSQKKINTKQELFDWIANSEKSLGIKDSQFCQSEKLDGFSVSLYYKNGVFTQAVSRGEGDEGEDITENVRKMKNVPNKLETSVTAYFRGEAMLTLANFERINEERANNKEKLFANPRNAASGIARRDDFKYSNELFVLCYDLYSKDQDISTEKEKLELIERLGLKTPKWSICKDREEIYNEWKKYEDSARALSPYEMDGLVISFNDIKLQTKLGVIDQKPRYSRAFKFTSQRTQTVLQEVIWATGRTGKITPVGKIKPVQISGVLVSSATLHNLAQIKLLGLKIGQKIEIKRAGDVIPKVERALDQVGSAIKIPSHCPSCGKKATAEDVHLMCYNDVCPGRDFASLLYWVKSLDIIGFGDKLMAKVKEAGLISDIADLYDLSRDDLLGLERMGEKSADKILQTLHSRKEIDLPIFVTGLGIPDFSEARAKMVQVHYPTIKQMQELTEDQLLEIHGIGEAVAKAIVEGFKSRKELIKKLLKHITIKEYVTIKGGGKLEKKSFCFTGARDKGLEESIIKEGGILASGISKNTTYLVAKDPSEKSSKLDKARSLGVKIISFSDAEDLLK